MRNLVESRLERTEKKSKAIALYRGKEDIQDVPHEMRRFVEKYLLRPKRYTSSAADPDYVRNSKAFLSVVAKKCQKARRPQ